MTVPDVVEGLSLRTRVELWTVVVSALILAALFAAPSAEAQGKVREWSTDDCRPASLADLSTDPSLEDKRRYVDVKVAAIAGREIVVQSVDLRFMLAPELLPLPDTFTEGINARFFGWLTREAATGRRYFYVKRSEVLSNDPELYDSELARLEAQGDPYALYAFADKVEAVALQQPDLKPLARKAFLRGVELEKARLSSEDMVAVLKLVDVIARRLQDRQRALDVLLEFVDLTKPLSADVQKRLKSLNAVQYGRDMRWMLHETMMEREGLVLVGQKWVAPERARLLEAIAERQSSADRNSIRHLPEFFRQAQLAGNVVPGMTKSMVVETKEQTYPTTFDRVHNGSSLYDGWFYPDGSALFFENDILFKKVAPALTDKPQ